MKIVNLTPHTVNVLDDTDQTIAIPTSGSARVATKAISAGTVSLGNHVFTVVETTYGQIEGLPQPEEGTIYIVSFLVLSALRAQGIDRADVVVPDTGPESVIRDSEGKILSVRRFTR